MSLTDFSTGAIYSGGLPEGLRAFYEQQLLATLRQTSVFMPFCIVKEDFAGRDTGSITYTEVFDTQPNWNPLAETDLWLPGAHLDSRKITIGLERHGDTLKFSDYTEIVNFFNSGDFRGLVNGKLGQNMVDYLDILAMNAHLDAPNVMFSDTAATSRFGLAADDYYDPDLGGLAYTHLEEMGIPGIQSVADGGGQNVLAITSPRVIRDIRKGVTGATKWLDLIQYARPDLKMRNEVGAWDGVRYIKSDRLRMRNYGTVTNQTTLNGATVAGQGSKSTVDGYSVGQSTSTRYINVTSSAGFAVGQTVTIHSQSATDTDGNGAAALNKDDGTQEHARIVAINEGGANRLSFARPLMKPHADGDYVTKAVDLSPTIVIGGPSVVYAVGERPNLVIPPKYDDHMMLNRIGWRGFLNLQMFRPEWLEIIWSAISTD